MLFAHDPAEWIRDHRREQALRDLGSYFTSYTGSRFDVFADHATPHAFTSRDFLAVSMLGVEVPARAAIWILEDGAAEIHRLLSLIPPGLRIGDVEVDFGPDGPARQLWGLMRSNAWNNGDSQRSGLGPTKLSKLLAAKRPGLFPVYDQHIASALLHDSKQSDWDAWQDRFSGTAGTTLRRECEVLCEDAGLNGDVSVLRILDVVIWMDRHGRDFAKSLPVV